jgi:hypothetical protein
MATQDRKLPLGKIEPNSLKYFLSCGVGGIIGMFKLLVYFKKKKKKEKNHVLTLILQLVVGDSSTE